MLSDEKTLKKILAIHNEELVFNTSDYSNDLQGSLAANVKFAQSQILPAKPKSGDKQPRLIANRKTLLLVKPLEEVASLQVTVINKEGREIGTYKLNKPELLPSTAYHIDGLPNNIDFTPLPGSKSVIDTAAVINQLSDPTGSLLLKELQTHAEVEIRTADGRWTGNIYLPQGPDIENKVIRFQSKAGYNSTIHYSGRSTTISTNNIFFFKYLSGQWVWEGDLTNQGIIYALNTWSIDLPARCIQPGFAMHFNSGERSGRLENIPVGAPTELLIHTIDVGMLTTPRDEFVFAKDTEAHREYFQTAPISKLIVGQYQSLHLTEVMLPNGQLLTDFDPSQGGVYDGTMRARIGKELISLGINHANYGINCSEGEGEWTPYLVAQLTAHNSRGKYANGIIIHGLSGGAGMVTLEDSLGNEFSHEVGHCYDLIHYPGEFDGSVHQSANSINSTWGWDSDRMKFLPNFKPIMSDKPSCYQDTCQATFHGRSFGFDPMAGGEPMAPINRFTLYTPYTATQIQDFMEKKVVFAADSATGFKKWNAETQRMEPFFHHVDTLRPLIAANKDLSANTLAALFAKNKMVGVTMADGNWAQAVYLPTASQSNQGALFSFNHNATYGSQLHINGQTTNVTRGFNKSYRSDGTSWKECVILTAETTRALARNDELNHYSLTRLLASAQLVNIVISASDWVPEVSVPPAAKENKQRILNIENRSVLDVKMAINGLSITLPAGEKTVYHSNGDRWLPNDEIVDISRQVKPEQSGVPVTTLVGYYDPQGILPGYIYPALHGAYGFVYKDDAAQLTEQDCQLLVESDLGVQRFKLDNNRLRSNVMNKFHINIAESAQPRTAKLICQGKVICQYDIQPAAVNLTYTINGESGNTGNDLTIAPSGLHVINATTDKISLIWDAMLVPVKTYRVYRNGQPTGEASLPGFTDTGLEEGTQYTYAVSAVYENSEESVLSKTISVTTPLSPVVPDVAPAAPGNLRSTDVTTSSIALAWDAAVAGSHALGSYSIFRSENGGITSVIASVPGSQLSWSDTALKADTRYSYFVIAYDVSGKMSTRSNTLQVTTDTPNTLRSWALNETFQTGEKVSYQNRIWVCIQGHTAWVMDWAPGGADSATLWRLA